MLRDVYRDLRDRRLLSIAIVLVAAIIAVPFLLGGGPEPVTAVDVGAISAEPPEGTPLLDPVVLSGQPGLRDPDERLKRLSNRNPFKQQSATPPGDASSGLQETDTTAGDGGGTTSESSGATVSVDQTSTATSSVPPVDEPSGSGGDPVASPPPVPPERPDPPQPAETMLVFFTVDVKVGPTGNARKMENVKPGEFLPDEDHPLVQYLRGEFDEAGASFAVSKEVTGAEGKGRCVPDRSRCEFLELRIGEEQRLTYGPDGKTYRIKLLDVVRHERALSEG